MNGHRRTRRKRGGNPLAQGSCKLSFGRGLREYVFVDETLARQRAIERQHRRRGCFARLVDRAREDRRSYPGKELLDFRVAQPRRSEKEKQEGIVGNLPEAVGREELGRGQALGPEFLCLQNESAKSGVSLDNLRRMAPLRQRKQGLRQAIECFHEIGPKRERALEMPERIDRLALCNKDMSQSVLAVGRARLGCQHREKRLLGEAELSRL